MNSYDSITVIYNPNSTGGSEQAAQDLCDKLRQRLNVDDIQCTPTQRAGHAETLAYDAGMKSKRPLVISVSGDGGYHEVINGLMQAKQDGAKPVAGLVASGNANDHFHALHGDDEWNPVESIVHQSERTVDLLHFTAQSWKQQTASYAHSYIGFGLTPEAGHALNQTKLNRLNELWIVFKSVLGFRPVQLSLNGSSRRYDSVTFSTVPRMSKVISLSDSAELDDAAYEMASLVHISKWQLFTRLVKASTVGLQTVRVHANVQLRTHGRTLVQLDGEIIRLPRHSDVAITIIPHALTCLA